MKSTKVPIGSRIAGLPQEEDACGAGGSPGAVSARITFSGGYAAVSVPVVACGVLVLTVAVWRALKVDTNPVDTILYAKSREPID